MAEQASLNPLIPEYSDPPPGGYTYQYTEPHWSDYQPHFATANPFYYSPLDISSGCARGAKPPALGCVTPISDGETLTFFDTATNSTCLAPAPCFAFKTQLVGICGATPSPLCDVPGMPSAPLYEWTWKSNFNGATGGVYGVSTASLYAADPGSGTGGITITSINGVPVSPTGKPDNLISKQANAGFVGDGVYNPTGAHQKKTATVAVGKTKTFYVTIQNDGLNTDTFTITGATGSADFSAKYIDQSGLNVTADVVAGTYSTGNLAPGAETTIRLRVRVKKSAIAGNQRSFKVTTRSASDSTVKDAVKAVVTAG